MDTADDLVPSQLSERRAPPGTVVPKTCGTGQGLFALTAFSPGDVILTFDPVFVDRATKYTIQVGDGRHLSTDGNPGALVNHSCAPNASFDGTLLGFVARQAILPGDQVTFNYLTTEASLAAPFDCSCGAPNCLHRVDGYEHLSDVQRGQLVGAVAPYLARSGASLPWWHGEDLGVVEGALCLSGRRVADLVDPAVPTYVYSAAIVRRRVSELRQAIRSACPSFRMYYAIKANRCRRLVETIRGEGDIGIDASSSREVALALDAGFAPHEISVTVSMPSSRDLAAFATHGVHVNLDTLSALRRWAAIAKPGGAVGLRLDPEVAIGYGDNPRLSYGNSKFGFAMGTALEAVAYARELGLEVDTLHIHAGWGLQQTAAPVLDGIFEHLAAIAREVPSVRTINVGGGLCWRQSARDVPLNLETWSTMLRRHFAPLGVTVACESGTYVTASAGVLVAEVNTVERRGSALWIGVNAGHNVNVYPAHYGIPLEIIHVARPLDGILRTYAVAGNINEAIDVFSRSARLPDVQEGDLLAFYPAGAYGASMASDHCLKGLPAEIMI